MTTALSDLVPTIGSNHMKDIPDLHTYIIDVSDDRSSGSPNENKLSGPGRATWRSLLHRPSSHTAPHRRAAWVRWSAWLGDMVDTVPSHTPQSNLPALDQPKEAASETKSAGEQCPWQGSMRQDNCNDTDAE